MARDFYIILAAQFFSSLADNTLLFTAIELLKDRTSPSWVIPVLQQFFVLSFILLAPFVGPFTDSLPKGKIMFISNSIKIIGCPALSFGVFLCWLAALSAQVLRCTRLQNMASSLNTFRLTD